MRETLKYVFFMVRYTAKAAEEQMLFTSNRPSALQAQVEKCDPVPALHTMDEFK